MSLTDHLTRNPALANQLLIALDEESHNVDPWVFGLPLHHAHCADRMKAIVTAWVADLESLPAGTLLDPAQRPNPNRK